MRYDDTIGEVINTVLDTSSVTVLVLMSFWMSFFGAHPVLVVSAVFLFLVTLYRWTHP